MKHTCKEPVWLNQKKGGGYERPANDNEIGGINDYAYGIWKNTTPFILLPMALPSLI